VAKAEETKAADETKASSKARGKAPAKEETASKPKTPARRFKRSEQPPEEIVRSYLDALDARDLDKAVKFWVKGGLERIVPLGDFRAPEGLRDFFGAIWASIPDSTFEILDLVADSEHVAVRWRSTGTFCGEPFQGLEPTGARLDFEGCDVFTVKDGRIQENNVYYDGAGFARQAGVLPPRDSAAEQRMTALVNARTRLFRRLFSPKLERVAEGVWVVRGGFPVKSMNVYLIEDDGGVTMFDAGIEDMTRGLGSIAAQMGGLKRIVLGHGHADHRGAAPHLGVPVFCHPDEVADAEGDGGAHYFDFSKLQRAFARFAMPRFLRRWDGGPVKIEGTVKEGDEIAGFEVVHFPGHAPGLIGLWRKSDRLALVSDTTYTLDPETGRHGAPRVPHAAFNKDTEQARESLRKLAALEPEAVWPGHADAVFGDVRQQLERAAETT
jgi:glyoxylase-like metal-dependent hydrolase (beta-lactamase superfamily II)/predicted ester cyclase